MVQIQKNLWGEKKTLSRFITKFKLIQRFFTGDFPQEK